MNAKKLEIITYSLLFLFSVQYFPLILQIPYSFFNTNFRHKSIFSQKAEILENGAGFLKKEPEIGFVSDVTDDEILLKSDPIMNFYIAQYALVPSIIKKGPDFAYTVGMFDKKPHTEAGISIFKQLSPNIIIFTRSSK